MISVLLAACCAIAGSVRALSGMPLAGAHVELRGGEAASATTGAQGEFSLVARPGSYRLAASARGYVPVSITLRADRDVSVQVSLEPLDSPKLRQIGEVTVDGSFARIQGTVPTLTLTRSQLDALGDDRIVDGLQNLPGATFARPDGGAASAVSVVALRGPDPSESLVALDGQLLGDGNTGDLDLSRLPVAAFSAVDVSEGLGPEDSNASNTFGGAIDLLSLRPTRDPHYSLSLSRGSFARSESWFNATGTRGRLGYAAAFDAHNEAGYVDRTVQLYSTSDAACAPCPTHLGSAVASRAALGTLTWSFSQNADATARVFILGDVRDQSGALDGIDRNEADRDTPQFGRPVGPGNQTFRQSIRAYQLRGRVPLGTGELTADLSASDDGVDLNGAGASAYDLTHRDRRYSGGLTWQRSFATARFAIGGFARYESLDFGASQIAPQLGQRIDVAFARGGFQPAAHVRLDGALFESHYSTFGDNLDARIGATYDAGPATGIRFSLGTGLRPPLLAERYEFPYGQLTLDANGVFVGQGSRSERPEHATLYEFGASHEFSKRATLDLSLYRTNLRNPIEVYYPLAAVASGACKGNSLRAPLATCVSYQSNVGNAVYQGAEVRFVQRFVPQRLFLTASYGLNVAFPKDLDAQFSNPTSGGDLVDKAQFLGIPQQQGSLQLDWREGSWHAAGSAAFRGKNNELAQPPFALVDALVGKEIGRHVDVSLRATNLFNAAAGEATLFGAGVPYRGVVGRNAAGNPAYGMLPTDALFVEPFALRLIFTLRS